MESKEEVKPKVIYSRYGMANYYKDFIEINYNLKYNKILRDYVMKHELGHSSKFDLHHEINDGFKLLTKPKICFQLIKFYLTNPGTWIDFLPIQIKRNKIVYDLNLLILYGIIGMIIYFLI